MSINRRIDQENVVCVHACAHVRTRTQTHTHTHTEILLCHGKNEIMPFVATWLDLEVIILKQSQKEKDIPYDIIYM